MLTNSGMLLLAYGIHAASTGGFPVAIAEARPWWEDPDRRSGA